MLTTNSIDKVDSMVRKLSKELEKFLQKEKLVLNKKTRIFKGCDNFIFLGYRTTVCF